MWIYLIALLLGVGVIMAWFAVSEWLTIRHWERYRAEEAERRRAKCEVAQHEWHKKHKPIRELMRDRMVQHPTRDASKK